MHLTPTFLDGVMLALNAVPDLCAVLDSHRCEMERVFKLDTVHDRYATLGGDGPYARNRRVFAVNWKQARDATGTEEQLLETLQAVAELHPGKPIAVLRGFVSLLVHTDIEGVVAMLEGEVSNPLVPIDQYSTDEDWIDGFRQVERSILRMVTGEGGSDEPLVSGFFLQRLEGDETGNRQAVDDLWTRAGLPERRWAMAGSPLVDTKRAPEAPLIRFPYSAPAREGGDEENVLRLDLPIGLERTSGVLRAAAERFGEPAGAEAVVEQERDRLKAELMPFVSRVLAGRGAVVAGDPWRAAGLRDALTELGMEVPLAIFLRRPGADNAVREALEASGTEVRVDPDYQELQAELRDASAGGAVDVVVGSGLFRDAAETVGLASVEAGFPHYLEHFASKNPFMGFEGVARLAERVANAIEAHRYGRTSVQSAGAPAARAPGQAPPPQVKTSATKPFSLADSSMRLSVPYNHDEDFLEALIAPHAPLIAEVYLPFHISVCHTARAWHGPFELRAYDEVIKGLHEYLRPRDIKLNFVANLPSSSGSDKARLVNEILRLDETFGGSLFTIRSLETAATAYSLRDTLDLQSSTLSHVNGPAAAWYWKQYAGSAGVTVDRGINRRPDVLAAIRKLGLKIRMVVNDDCIPSCPSEDDHMCDIALGGDLGLSRGTGGGLMQYTRCRPFASSIKREFAWMVVQKEILPFHLPRLEGLVDQIKITGRCATTDYVVDCIERYSRGEARENSLFREPDEAWDMVATCDRACEACGWCEENIELLGPKRSN